MKQFKLSLGLIILILMSVEYIAPSIKAQTNDPTPTLNPCDARTFITHLITSQDGKYLAANWQGGVRIWEIETGSAVGTYMDDTMHYDDTFAISSDSKYLLTGGFEGVAILWDVVSAKKIHSFELTSRIQFVAFLPDNMHVLITDIEESSLWNIQTFEKDKVFSVDDRSILTTQLSLDGKRLLTDPEPSPSDFTQFAQLWDVDTGEELHRFEQVHEAFLSPNSKYILTGGSDGYILWDAQSYAKLHYLGDYLKRKIEFNAFSLDDNYLYGRERDTAIVVWDAPIINVFWLVKSFFNLKVVQGLGEYTVFII
jgi:WD40 repeat protein